MSEAAELRRHLYEQYAALRRRDWRARGRLTRQIALLAATRPGPRDDGGPSGVREPRRPQPPLSGAARALRG